MRHFFDGTVQLCAINYALADNARSATNRQPTTREAQYANAATHQCLTARDRPFAAGCGCHPSCTTSKSLPLIAAKAGLRMSLSQRVS
jgi:hypothetical protein